LANTKPTLQSFEISTGTGGLSLLQDGFKALQSFKELCPDSYQRLCEISIPSEYIEGDGQHHKYTAPIIRLDPLTKLPDQIRINTLDRAPLNTIPIERVSQFYADYRKLTQEIQDAEKEWWFKLEPGTVVIFDNWRLMHGR
jgi:trimethyllysine dioxygenase